MSGTGTAHWYGCDHLPDYEYLVPPKYGWIEDRNAWPRIGNLTMFEQPVATWRGWRNDVAWTATTEPIDRAAPAQITDQS